MGGTAILSGSPEKGSIYMGNPEYTGYTAPLTGTPEKGSKHGKIRVQLTGCWAMGSRRGSPEKDSEAS